MWLQPEKDVFSKAFYLCFQPLNQRTGLVKLRKSFFVNENKRQTDDYIRASIVTMAMVIVTTPIMHFFAHKIKVDSKNNR